MSVFLNEFARHCSSNRCVWRLLCVQRLMLSYCTCLLRFRVPESVTPCNVQQVRHLKLCLVTPVNVCVSASDEQRKLDGHGYWFWYDQCCTPRWGGAMRVAVRWDRFATAAMVCTCAKFLGSRPRCVVRLPTMTDTLTRTTVGDESWYSYCLRSQLLVLFSDPSGSSLVIWCAGLLVALNFARHRQVDGRALASGGWKGACVTWCVACALHFCGMTVWQV